MPWYWRTSSWSAQEYRRSGICRQGAWICASRTPASVISSTPSFNPMDRKYSCSPDASGPLKAVANRLARMAALDEVANALRELRAFGVFPGQENGDTVLTAGAEGQSHSHPQDDCRRVGIWEKQTDSGHFVRRADMIEEWHLWANAGRIFVNRAKRRVILIGESVARGYLFDPQYTPAKALESILISQLGPGEVEVVDLAKTNLLL